MTYLQFHLLFILPPLAVLLPLAWRRRHALGPRGPWALWLLPPIALAYTTPWDNYLVASGVWSYGSDRVVGTVGWVPVEEYAFFLLQPLLTGAVLYLLLARAVRRAPHAEPPVPASPDRARLIGGLLAVALVVTGALLLRSEPGRYMGLILVWAVPVIGALWVLEPAAIRRVGRSAALGVSLPTVYLWIADRIAIGQGTWTIADRYTLGLDPLGLPIEEATFFLATNLLVVFGLVLFVAPGLPALRGR